VGVSDMDGSDGFVCATGSVDAGIAGAVASFGGV
jgi:hypothetical protein